VDIRSDLEDKTERLSSLEKFMQIRTKTEIWSKNYKSDLFDQVTHFLILLFLVRSKKHDNIQKD